MHEELGERAFGHLIPLIPLYYGTTLWLPGAPDPDLICGSPCTLRAVLEKLPER